MRIADEEEKPAMIAMTHHSLVFLNCLLPQSLWHPFQRGLIKISISTKSAIRVGVESGWASASQLGSWPTAEIASIFKNSGCILRPQLGIAIRTGSGARSRCFIRSEDVANARIKLLISSRSRHGMRSNAALHVANLCQVGNSG